MTSLLRAAARRPPKLLPFVHGLRVVPWGPSTVLVLCVAGLGAVGLAAYAFMGFANTLPIDRLAVRRPWDHRGIGEYRGRPQNPDVPPGMSVVIGRPVRRGIAGSRLRAPIGAGWEACTVIYAGPRVGKTTSYVVPAIAGAPGAVIATSNKRDLVDGTRLIRETLGRAWVFDPQGVVRGGDNWWWNPLRSVSRVQDAQDLAQLWMDVSRGANSTADAYFEPAGQQLLAALIFAAAEGDRPVTDVFWWLTDPARAQEALDVLDPRVGLRDPRLDPERRAELQARQRLFSATAQSVASVISQPDKQRGGVFGTAMKAVEWMQSPELRRWIEDPSGAREEFVTADFAGSTDTLYSLSREGSGAVVPLVTALTADVLLTAGALAASSPGGRLSVPLLAALDEAANICPWRQLPRMFSFFGSAGIPLLAVFQSPAQLRSVFGDDGAAALHSAANVRITMGGIEDIPHLQALEQLMGQVRVQEHSHNRAQGGGGANNSRSTSWRDRSAVTVDQLAAMGRLRAVATLSGTAPVLVQPLPWHKSKKLAPGIRASIARYGANSAALALCQADGHPNPAGIK
jgi:type IV secretory pathway TraG/TraD family ATPase VirD4